MKKKSVITQPSSTPEFDEITKLPVQSSSIKKIMSQPFNDESNPKTNHVDDEILQEKVKIES